MRRFALYLALTAALTACSASGGDDAGGGEPPSSGCEPASAALITAIEAGLTVIGGGSLSNAYIVPSGDFVNVYFVAAQIEGEGMGDAVGVWATNGPNGDGSIFAADSMAAEFSDWASSGELGGRGFNSSDDGLSDARACAGG